MGYLGLTPTTAQQNYLNIDDISGSFNGTTTSFALQVGGVAPTPFPVTNSCLISVGGVVQQPDDTGTDGFRISGGNIIFSSAPGTGEDFFGLVLAGADYLNVGANFPDGTVGTPSITFASDLNTGIYHPSTDSIAITSGGTAALTIDSNRRVGLGTSSPSSLLHLDGVAEPDIRLESTSGPYSQISSNTVGSLSLKADAGNTGASSNISFLVDGANAMRVDSSGRVGIGTTSPSERLHVLDNTNNVFLQVEATGTAKYAQINLRGTSTANYISSDDDLAFYVNAGERARIDTSGHLIVGGTTAGNAGTVTVSIGNPGATTGGLQLWAATNGSSYIQFGDSSASASDHYRGLIGYQHDTDRMIFYTAGSERLRIASDGTFQLRNSPGIDFSQIQTNAAGVTSEILDSYEEGEYTPNFGAPGGSAGSAAYSSAGKYVKIGKLVMVYGELYITNKGSWSGTVTFGNLPFTAESGRQNLGACWFTNVSVPTQTFYQSRVGPSESYATMPKITNNGGDDYMQISDITTNSAIRFTVSYTTS